MGLSPVLHSDISCSPFHRVRLESEAEQLMKTSGDMESERLQDIYERLDELDAAHAETKAARLLHGLGDFLTQ